MIRNILTVSGALLCAGVALPAMAQSADQGPERVAPVAAADLGDIVVTARKKNESLLQVPLSVSAFTAETLQAKGITDLAGIAANTPGFNVTNTGNAAGAVGGSRADRGVQNLSIRGVFNHSSVFIDGAPVNSGFVEGVTDVQRVEVVKGPQSAYFGRNTFIGAINLVTKTPGNDFKGSVSATYGAYDLTDLRGTVEGPLIRDKLAVRIAVRDFSTHGQYDNAGGPSMRLGDQSTKSVNATIYATPTDNLSIKLFGLYWKDSDGAAAVGKFTRQDYNCNAGGAPVGTLNYICGTLPTFPASRLAQNTVLDALYTSVVLKNSTKTLAPIFDRMIDHGGLERRAYHLSANVEYTIPGSRIILSSLTSMNENKYEILSDIDNVNTANLANPFYGQANRPFVEPYTNWLFYYQNLDRDFSQEFRLTSGQSQRLRWMAGANYTHTSSAFYVTQDNPIAGPIANGDGAPVKTNTYGGYFSLAYDLTDHLTLNGEGRYQIDQIQQYVRKLNRPLDGTATTSLLAQANYKNFVPRVIAQYKFDRDNMVYATYSKGVSPGGFNVTLITATQVQLAALGALSTAAKEVQPEKLNNYEFGYKGRLFNNRLQLTAAAYYAVWKDQIVNQIVPLPSVDINGNLTGGTTITGVRTNIGKTDLKGIEFEANVVATARLVLSFAGSVNDSVIKAFDCQAPCVAITGSPNVVGDMLPSYSKWNGVASAAYTQPISPGLNGFARVDYTYKSGMYDTFTNTAKTADAHTVNVHLGLKAASYSIEGFVTNLFDNRAAVSIERNVDVLSAGFSDNVLNVGVAQKRSGGVRVRYDF